jgi:hypothetical protein
MTEWQSATCGAQIQVQVLLSFSFQGLSAGMHRIQTVKVVSMDNQLKFIEQASKSSQELLMNKIRMQKEEEPQGNPNESFNLLNIFSWR